MLGAKFNFWRNGRWLGPICGGALIGIRHWLGERKKKERKKRRKMKKSKKMKKRKKRKRRRRRGREQEGREGNKTGSLHLERS